MDTVKYNLRYSRDFLDDMREIVDYIALTLGNPDAAQRLLNDVHSAIVSRLNCPTAFEPYRSNAKLHCVWYRIHVRNYIVFYTVTGNVMEVHRVLYNRRNWRSMF